MTGFATETFRYDPPVAADQVAAWQATLDAVVPRVPEAVSHLRLVWEPGDPWDPVHRWYLYDCTPRRVFEEAAMKRRLLGVGEDDNADAILLRDLDGPSPREQGYYDQVLREFQPADNRECTLQQWRLWRQDGVYGIPWWVIQGTQGGHKRWWSVAEKKILRYAKLPDEPPVPGSLPYAPFDRRVLDRVLTYDRLRRVEAKLNRIGVRQEHHALVVQARTQYLQLLTDAVLEARDRTKHLDLPTGGGPPEPDRDWSAAIDAFLQRED